MGNAARFCKHFLCENWWLADWGDPRCCWSESTIGSLGRWWGGPLHVLGKKPWNLKCLASTILSSAKCDLCFQTQVGDPCLPGFMVKWIQFQQKTSLHKPPPAIWHRSISPSEYNHTLQQRPSCFCAILVSQDLPFIVNSKHNIKWRW